VTGLLLIGLILSPLAGLAAFAITYEEYRRHFHSPRPALRHAVSAGLFTMVFFSALSVLAIWALAHFAR
jgi:hypothetical protein